MNSSQEETYQSLMDYFTGRRVRILTSNSPSYIRVEFGSWVSFSFQGNAKGEAEVNITKRNGGSYINFNFNFLKEYLGDFLMAIVGALFIYFVPQWFIASLPNGSVFLREMGGIVNFILLGMIVVTIGLIMGMAGYATSLTRKRFIDEFNMFAQSLPTKEVKKNDRRC